MLWTEPALSVDAEGPFISVAGRDWDQRFPGSAPSQSLKSLRQSLGATSPLSELLRPRTFSEFRVTSPKLIAEVPLSGAGTVHVVSPAMHIGVGYSGEARSDKPSRSLAPMLPPSKARYREVRRCPPRVPIQLGTRCQAVMTVMKACWSACGLDSGRRRGDAYGTPS